MACVTQGSAVTSPLLPRELAEHLPPLADYAPPEDQTGATDVRIRDHWARTLRVAILCHRLDMTLRQEPGSSRTLVRSRHCCGDLLGLLPQPRDHLGAAFQGRGDSGPQGEPKASQDKACKGGDVSDEL